MSRDDGKYSRLYWSVKDDPKFDGIRSDPAVFGTWALLLMDADAAWPSSANLPRWVRKRHLDTLVTATLVDLLADDRYRIHGLDAERERRAASARVGATVRHATDVRPYIERTSTVLLDEDETSTRQERDEKSRANFDGRADLEAFLLITRRAPTPKQRRLLDELVDRHDLTGPAWSADIMLKNPDDPIGAVIAADKAWRSERIREAQKAEAPKPVARRSRGLPTTTKEIMAEMAELQREAS